MTDWYRVVDGQVAGPISKLEVYRLVQASEIGRNDLLWCPGMPGWAPADRVPGFFLPPPVPGPTPAPGTDPPEIPVAPPVIQPPPFTTQGQHTASEAARR